MPRAEWRKGQESPESARAGSWSGVGAVVQGWVRAKGVAVFTGCGCADAERDPSRL